MPEFYLDHLAGERAGSSDHLTDAEVVRIGRSDECDLCFDEMGVSWEHAEFRFRDGDFWLIDQGSTNGTYVNDERAHNARLKGGDVLKFGKRGPVMKFRLEKIIIPQSSAEQPSASAVEAVEKDSGNGDGEKPRSSPENPLPPPKAKPRPRLPSQPDFPVPDLNQDAAPDRRHSDLPPAAALLGSGQSTSPVQGIVLVVVGLVLCVSLILLGLLYMEYNQQEADLIRAQDARQRARRELNAFRASMDLRLEEARQDGQQEERDAARRQVERLEREAGRAKRRAEDRINRQAEKIERLERENDRLRRELNTRKRQRRARFRVGNGPEMTKDWAEIERKLSGSVVLIVVRMEGRRRKDGTKVVLQSYGTGFFASSQGHIVTNKHVVEPWKYKPLAYRLLAEDLEVVPGSLEIHAWPGGTRFIKGKGKEARVDLSRAYTTRNGSLEVVRVSPDKWDDQMLDDQGAARVQRAHQVLEANDLAVLRAKIRGRVTPIPLGRSSSVDQMDEVLVLGFGSGAELRKAGVAKVASLLGEVKGVATSLTVPGAGGG